jgi:hypothetical protein
MVQLIKRNKLILLSVTIFIASLTTFAVTQASANSQMENDCHHCGTIDTCLNGGQDYGYNGCLIRPGEIGTPNGCEGTHGTCGGQPDPIEG